MPHADTIMRTIYKLVEMAYEPVDGADLEEVLDNLREVFGNYAFDAWINHNLQASGCSNENCDAGVDWQ